MILKTTQLQYSSYSDFSLSQKLKDHQDFLSASEKSVKTWIKMKLGFIWVKQPYATYFKTYYFTSK